VIITRRGVLTGLIAAPMIVRPASIMRVRSIRRPPWPMRGTMSIVHEDGSVTSFRGALSLGEGLGSLEVSDGSIIKITMEEISMINLAMMMGEGA
jgi:hypothetical protein